MASGEKGIEDAKRRPVHLVYRVTEDGKLDVILATRSPTKAMTALQEDRTLSFTDLMVD